MLSAYIVGLKAYYIQLGRKQGSKRPSLDGWDRALQSADRALAAFREAEVQRKDGDLDSADATVDQALLALQERYTLICSLITIIPYSDLSVQEQCRLFTDLTSS